MLYIVCCPVFKMPQKDRSKQGFSDGRQSNQSKWNYLSLAPTQTVRNAAYQRARVRSKA